MCVATSRRWRRRDTPVPYPLLAADVIGDDRAIFAPLGTTSAPLTRYAMLESTMDNLLLAASAASADLPIALSNGWRYGAPIPAGPITEMDVWNIVPANPQVSVATLTGA